MESELDMVIAMNNLPEATVSVPREWLEELVRKACAANESGFNKNVYLVAIIHAIEAEKFLK